MRSLLGVVAVTTLIATPATAQQMTPGGYIMLNAGAMWLRDVDADIGGGFTATGEFKTGFHLAGGAGYRLGNGLRIEGELSYGKAGFDKISVGGITGTLSGVKADVLSMTVNAFYDIDTGTNFRPYIGGGVGMTRWSQSDGTLTVPGVGAAAVDKSHGTDLTLLGEVGVSIAVSPQLEIVPAYRFQWINHGGDGTDSDAAHIAKVGLRYNFSTGAQPIRQYYR